MFKLLSGAADVNSLQISSLIRFALMWCIYIVLAWSEVSMEGIARFELFIFTAGLFAFAFINGGKNAILNFSDDEGNKNQLIAGSFICFVAAGAAMSILLWVLGSQWVQLPPSFSVFEYNHLLTAYVFFLISGSVLDYYLLLKKRYRLIVLQSILINGGMLSMVIWYAFFHLQASLLFTSLVVLLVFQLAFVVYLVLPGFKWVRRFPFYKFLSDSFLPLSLFALLGGLATFIDGYLVLFLTEAPVDFAVFRYGARELPLSVLLAGGISAAMIPVLVQNSMLGKSRMKSELQVLYKQVFPISILLMLISPLVFPIVFTADFAAAAGIFNIYLIIVVSRVLLPQAFLYAAKKNKILLSSAAVEIVINVALSIYLFQYWGIYGIAWASVVAYFCSKAIMSGYLLKRKVADIGTLLLPIPYLIYTVILFLAYFISTTYTVWL